MKINSLLESQTPSSAIANTTSSAPEFGRDDDKLEETTTSGSVATVASPIGKVQRRGKGSMLQGIKTSSKYPNSKQVKEAGYGSVTVNLPTKIQGDYRDDEMDFYDKEIDDLAMQADPEFKAWIQDAEKQLVDAEYNRKDNTHLAKVLSAYQVKKFGSKTLGQKLGNAAAGKSYAYYTPEIKAIMDGPVKNAGNIIARRTELENNIEYVKQTWNRMSEDDRQKWAASVGMSYDQLEHVVRTGKMPNQQLSHTEPEQEVSEAPTLANIRRQAAPKSAENQREWNALSQEEKAKAIQRGQAGAKSNTPVGEAKKANTKTARAEFGKRVKAKPNEKEQEQKKSESDAAWERLMAYAAAQKEKVNEVDPHNFDSDEDYYDAVEADDLDLDKFGNGWDIPDEIAVLRNQLRHTTSQYARDQIENKIKRYEDIYYGEDSLEEASKSKAQFRTMAAVAHNPKFAKKVGIKQSVGKEFHKADKKQDYKDLPKEVDEGFSDMMAKERKKRLAAAEKKKQERLAKEKENKKNKEQGVAEMDGNGSGRDGSNRKRIGSYGSRDRDITGPDVHLGSDSMMASKDMQDRALAKLTKMLSEPENMNVLKRLKTKEGVAEGWDPDTTRLEQDVRDALENGDDYTAKQYARMASTPEAKKYLLNIIKQAMYIDDLGGETNWKGVAEEKKKGADGKACWDGYRYNGTEDGKDSCVKVSEAEFTEDKLALDLYKDLQIFKKGADKDIGQKAKDKDIGNKPKDKDIVAKESFNGEYDDEAGSAESNLLTSARAVKGLLDTIEDRDNLPEWVQEKIAKAEGMLVATWDYLQSQKEQGIDPQVDEDWQKTNKQDKTDGMSPKAVKAYRRENPGSKLQTAVTKKPSELKAGSKDAKRRKSFCARMSGNKGPMKDEKGRPTPKAKALRRWNCE